MISAIIIDDEALSRKRLQRLLVESFSSRINIIAEAANGQEALSLIEHLSPDLIFLDIEMPVMDGFELLGALRKEPAVIFVTAYDQFAVKAFEENAIDYLLKPIESERLAKSISKVEQHLVPSFQALKQLLTTFQPEKKDRPLANLVAKLNDRILILKLDELLYLEAEDKYVFIHTKNGNRYPSDYTLSHLEKMLPTDFLRIHRSLILNRNQVKELRKGFNGSFTFLLNDEKATKLKSSRGYLETIRKGFSI